MVPADRAASCLEVHMSYVNESNFDAAIPKTMRDAFWARVRESLRDILHADPRMADRYRKLIEKGTVREQILVFHDHPLNIAADLAGREGALEDEFKQYDASYPDEITAPAPVLPSP